MTASEKFVSELSQMSFLPFWSFASPVGKKGKELCDLLVVCENTIIIISVKDISLSEHEDESIVYQRWVKKAIHESVSQIHGAERFLSQVDTVQLKNSLHPITLPPKSERIVYRIAIAFGSQPHFPIPTGHFQYGFVNVFDENATRIIFKELDTITDFTQYLKAKQVFAEKHMSFIPAETDLLALYFQTGLIVEEEEDTVLFIDESLWDGFAASEQYQSWKTDIEVSYVWDIMIQSFFINHVNPNITIEKRMDLERSLVVMNLESRMRRKELGLILEDTLRSKLKARMLQPTNGAKPTYVFMPLTEENWEFREAELGLRCIVARAEFPEAEKIVGIAIGRTLKEGITFEVHLLDFPSIDQQFIDRATAIKNDLGLFKNITVTRGIE